MIRSFFTRVIGKKDDLTKKYNKMVYGHNALTVDERVSDEMFDTICKGICPACGGTLLAGPRGGCAQNVLCNDCRRKYNVYPFGATYLGMEHDVNEWRRTNDE